MLTTKPQNSYLPNSVRMEDWKGILAALTAIHTKIKRNDFAEQIIDTFKEQREGHQFAVVIYCSQADIDSGFKHVNFITEDKHGMPLLNSDLTCVPEYTKDITNYLAARPEYKDGFFATLPSDKVHAENILMSHLDVLTIAYLKRNHELPAQIFLYTWFTPCSKCSELIIDKLCSYPYNEIPTTVLYTAHTCVSGDDVEKARKSLRDAGFEVEQVPYNSYLPMQKRAVASI